MITKNSDLIQLKDKFLKDIAIFLLDKKQLEYTEQTGSDSEIYYDDSFMDRVQGAVDSYNTIIDIINPNKLNFDYYISETDLENAMMFNS